MKQLAYVVGEDKFRDGLRLYLKDHAYANAEWADLVGSFEKVSGQPLGPWADAYIKRRGMPQVDVEKMTCGRADHVTEPGVEAARCAWCGWCLADYDASFAGLLESPSGARKSPAQLRDE